MCGIKPEEQLRPNCLNYVSDKIVLPTHNQITSFNSAVKVKNVCDTEGLPVKCNNTKTTLKELDPDQVPEKIFL